MLYPNQIDTPDSLYNVANSATSPLTADISSSDTVITLNSTAKFPSGRFILSVESELIVVASKNDSLNQLTVEQRGAFGTSAVPHVATSRANVSITAQHYEALRDTVIDVQENLWSYRKPVEAITSTVPSTPVVGIQYIVAEGASGDWSGLDDKIVTWDGSAWLSVTPENGFQVYDKQTENLYKYTSRGWEPGATANTPTDIKTANYQAKNGELVRCTTLAGSFTVTLPDAPEDGDVVAILDVSNWFATNNLILAQGSPTQNIQGNLDNLALNISGTYIELFWNAVNNDWRLLETPTFVPVTKVFGRTGDVIAQSGDYTASQVTFTPVGNLSSTDVQSAIAELDSEKSNAGHNHDGYHELISNKVTTLSAGSTDVQYPSAKLVHDQLAGKASISHTHDASAIVSGTIDIARLPASVIERLVVVADDVARFALTTTQVQNGDVVKVVSTNTMYYVKDDTQLNVEAGYEVFKAGSAASVPWSGVTDKPSTFTPSAHTHSISDVTGLQTALDGKQDDITTNGILKGDGAGNISAVVSGVDIKTINGVSLLGSGNITITGGTGGTQNIDGGAALTVFLVDQGFDGGTASTIYDPSDIVDGGLAN